LTRPSTRQGTCPHHFSQNLAIRRLIATH